MAYVWVLYLWVYLSEGNTTLPLWYNLNLGTAIFPALLVLLRIILAEVFCASKLFRIFFSISMMNSIGILMKTAVNLYDSFSKMATLLTLPSQEPGRRV